MAEIKHFVRIVNTDIPGNKPVISALTKVHGIGINFAQALCNKLSIDANKKAGTLTDVEISSLELLIKNPTIPQWYYNRRKDPETGENHHILTSALKLTKETDIKQLKKIKTYKGIRHSMGQPVRGQRTRSHFRKGSAVGVVKKKIVKTKEKA